MKLLGIDYGTKKIGLALATITDTSKHLGPLKILDNTPNHPIEENNLKNIAAIVSEESINEIIIGLPFSKGVESNSSKPTREFGNRLKKLIKPHIKVFYVDESHTSNDTIEASLTIGTAKGQRHMDDSLAACEIIKRHLENPK